MSRQRNAGGSAPLPLLVLGTLGALFFIVPVVGLLSQVPWSDMPDLVSSPIVTDALRISLISSFLATGLAVLFGVPLAWLLARTEFKGKPLVRALVTLPMVLPPVVGGAALLSALGRSGLVGGPLNDATGIVLPFSLWGVVLANTFVAMPFLVVTVEGALTNSDEQFELVAQSLGSSRLSAFRRVTVPMIAPSLRAGLVLAWARSIGEFGATVTFAGNLQGRTQTLPLAVFVALESDRDTALALSLILIAVSLTVLLTMRRSWWGVR